MTSRPLTDREYERLLSGWLTDQAQVRVPDGLLGTTLTRTAGARTGRFGWGPLTIRLDPSFGRLAWLLAALALIGAVGAAVAIGSRQSVPDPVGPARNGWIAFADENRVTLVASDGSTSVRVPLDEGASLPAFSPDGTRLAYVRRDAGAPDGAAARTDLVIAAADGSRPTVIETDAFGMSLPSWSPDGRWLTYSRIVDPATSLDQVFVVPADGSAWPRAIGDPSTPNRFPRFAPDGSRITYFRGNDGVFTMRPDGQEIDGLTTVFFGRLDWLEWSPDGSRIVFSGAKWSESDLWLVGLDGRQEVALTDNHNGQTGASWSPSGERLAYLTDNGTGQARLVVADERGASPTVLPGTWGWVTPVWSPDGTRIAVATDRTNGVASSLQLVDPDGRLDPIVVPGSPVSISWQRVAP